MPTAELKGLLTTADLLAMPDDGMDRWLIRGELRERAVTKRNRWHSWLTIRIGHLLSNWQTTEKVGGEVLGGEAGCILSHDPETAVGIDVAWFCPEVIAQQTGTTTMIDGPPVLAVEILSPSDTQQDLNEKTDAYLSAGVKVVWIVSPHQKSIIVLTGDRLPVLYNTTQLMAESPWLPGLKLAVRDIFPEDQFV